MQHGLAAADAARVRELHSPDAGTAKALALTADFGHLVEHIDPDTLQRLRYIGPGGTYWRRGLLIGLAAGYVVGYGIGSRCGPGAAPSECTFSGMVYGTIGTGLGAGVGAAIGGSSDRPSSTLIYSVP
jgi:hypothetical protein